MRKRFFIFIMVSILPVNILAQAGVDVATPQARMAAIDTVKALLTTSVVADSAETLNSRNPFNPVKQVETKPDSGDLHLPIESNAGGDRQKLEKIAEGITPSGTMQLGGVPILLFGQKKFKVGDILPIIFEGSNYEIQITAIERISFTLRLNNEEITRPIKSVATKP